ncbi:MAG: bifunctional demethylmenaquinone methyltransferase/2-methoxy-6-polyprenyl-1,4-benzoquinol methylase UbiE [Gemmatimonadota bacterium]|nr:bifunctional demethylmenaquinone methyltransferase/2-methoxy-6-polyprenyl-1,4-benzoquinol methylase UbiE [Gemmatimonadota bacterium]
MPEVREETEEDLVVDPRDPAKGRKVRTMFAGIAHRYDLINRLFCAGRDQAWRARTVRMAGLEGGERVLDLCCGTGDFAVKFAKSAKAPSLVVGCDFTPEMLVLARKKAKGLNNIELAAADALQLPFPDRVFDVVSVGFGVRNFEKIDTGLSEIARVLKPGGRLVVLDATPGPKGLVGRLSGFYIRHLMPRLGRLVSGNPYAYSYLSNSISAFAPAEELAADMERAGFEQVTFSRLNFGTVAVHVGTRGG